MQSVSRRKLFTLISGSMLVATAGCTTTRVGTSTTTTIDVAKINAYIEAASNGATMILNVIKTIPTLPEYITKLDDVITHLAALSAQFTAQTAGKVVIAYNDANIRTILDSIFDTFKQFAAFIDLIIGSLESPVLLVDASVIAKIRLVYDSVVTLVSILKVTLYPTLATVNTHSFQTVEAQALKTLNV